ncbi:MAG TPA: hypothetical protein VHQ24_04610 [Lachnospiraceae bacterium]|nr:hypothetical protein [Lachnospiraceae bacterium]
MKENMIRKEAQNEFFQVVADECNTIHYAELAVQFEVGGQSVRI